MSMSISIEKDDELKGGNFTDANEGIIEYGKDFLIFKIIPNREPT